MAKSKKWVGDSVVNWLDEQTDKVPLLDRLKNQRKYKDKELKRSMEGKTPKKPKRKTPQTKNEQMDKDLRKSRKLSKEQVAEIRRKLKRGEKVKTKDY